jgi:ketosteroid isomerase-like protein
MRLVAATGVLLASLLAGAGSSQAQVSDPAAVRDSIRALLSRQVAAWNRGDLEAFMAGYARSDSLRFASGGTVQTGWRTTLARYRRAYPDTAAMGRLAFDDLQIDPLSEAWAMAFGRWRLQRTGRPEARGLFTLVLRRLPSRSAWRIVHDHTSSASAE